MTVKEYNTVWCKLINNSTVFLGALEHAIQKAESPEQALSNLRILGWGPELKAFLSSAVSVYQEILRNQIETPAKAEPVTSGGNSTLSDEVAAKADEAEQNYWKALEAIVASGKAEEILRSPKAQHLMNLLPKQEEE